MGFPLMGADRIFITEEPVALPIPGDNRKGVFSIDASGTVQQLDRSAAVPGTALAGEALFQPFERFYAGLPP